MHPRSSLNASNLGLLLAILSTAPQSALGGPDFIDALASLSANGTHPVSAFLSLARSDPSLFQSIHDTKAGFTLFVPTDAAISAAGGAGATNVSYHISHDVYSPSSAGRTILLSYITGTQDFVLSSHPQPSGIIHVVDQVLTPPLSLSETATKLKLNSYVSQLQLFSIAPQLEKLASITVLAPNDDAVAAFAGPSDNMTGPEISSVVEGMVIPGVYFTPSILPHTFLTAIQTYAANISLSLTSNPNAISFTTDSAPEDPANVYWPSRDIPILNGVLHVVDRVLLPTKEKLDEASFTGGGDGGNIQEITPGTASFPGVTATPAPVVSSTSSTSSLTDRQTAGVAVTSSVGTIVVVSSSSTNGTKTAFSVPIVGGLTTTTSFMASETSVVTDTDTDTATDMATDTEARTTKGETSTKATHTPYRLPNTARRTKSSTVGDLYVSAGKRMVDGGC
ncbi:hypothetical protein HK101_009819 [Irineochytrium annulatum]|nr:hypothetical protein HK101_009819 [Irineochytrium annulatum]